MKLDEFNRLGAELSLTAYGNKYFGLVDGWPLMLDNSSGFTIQLTTDTGKDSYKAGQIRSSLKNSGAKLKAWKGYLMTISAPSSSKLQGSMGDFIRYALRTLRSVGLGPSDTCPYCGSRNCDAVAPTFKGYRPAHFNCLREQANKVRSKANYNMENGSYLTGVLGALIGMIIGTIPSLLTIVYMQMEYAVLFALIPICAYLGYKIFQGKMNKAALIVSIVMAVLGVVIMYFEFILFTMVHDYGYPFSEALRFLPVIMRDPEVWKEAFTGSLQEFLFSAIGVFVAWGLISRTATGAVADADTVLRLAQPYGARRAQTGYETNRFY